MSSGAIPVIRNWPGADHLYPRHFVFADIAEAAELIVKWRTTEEYLKQKALCQIFAMRTFDHLDIYRRLVLLIEELRVSPRPTSKHRETGGLRLGHLWREALRHSWHRLRKQRRRDVLKEVMNQARAAPPRPDHQPILHRPLDQPEFA